MSTQTNSQIAISAEDIDVAYGKSLIIEQLNVAFPAGKVTAIIGPNGCGKSTLLSAMSRLIRPVSGQVVLDGRDLSRYAAKPLARKLGLLPQNATAPEGLLVSDLIRLGRHPHQGMLRQWSDQDQKAFDHAVDAAGVAQLLDRPLDRLSGGQRQRAWIAMTIAQDTAVMMLDEPTAFLDIGHQLEVFSVIGKLRAMGRTCVLVLHDIVSAARFADNIIAMKDGKIVANGTPDQVITTDLIRTLYEVECELVADPVFGSPVITSMRLA
ncbi:ABC transporter ATP-binding protein [Thalassospira sp. MA62]|nr:ABC transporter ATP-binding protein [Thalassospira sp. MA62]